MTDSKKKKISARGLVNAAIVSGKLKRQPCQVCGSKRTDAHHADYGKPLDVVWLCRTHHAAEHGLTKEKVSRQREWSRRQVEAGKCGLCGEPREHYEQVCDSCASKARTRMRGKKNFAPWRPGGKGRPPIVKEILV